VRTVAEAGVVRDVRPQGAGRRTCFRNAMQGRDTLGLRPGGTETEHGQDQKHHTGTRGRGRHSTPPRLLTPDQMLPGERTPWPFCPVAESPRSWRTLSANSCNRLTTSGYLSARLVVSPGSFSRSNRLSSIFAFS